MASSRKAASPPSPKAVPPPSPNLDECIKSIILLGSNAAALSTRNQATLTNAMVGYCVHLARDQDALATLLRSSKEFPNGSSFSDLPAIREMVKDPSLFRCILSLLSHSPNSGTGAYQQKHGRKRSPSEDVPHTASRKKPMLSPTPANRLHPKQALMHAGVAGECPKGQLSEKSIPVVAATILYSVFQHTSHWPVHIMKAFAEDSFGPRNWVDDERCKAFVSNLEISIKSDEAGVGLDQSASAAENAEKYFSSLLARASIIKPAMSSSNKIASNSPSQQKALSSKEKQKQVKPPKSSDEDSDEDSSSGEEEVLESESLPTKNMEDDSGMPTVSSLPQARQSSATTSPLHIIFNQSSISKKRVRPRYHMHSLDLVYEAISDAFQDRLNSKSKQNYRLLQVLPSFLPIPRVRCLASRHLERWLQSPALAGLARTLFARIAQELRCVEPPLREDLEVINNILQLNLKANQLSFHIEHVTLIAKKMPTQSVAQMIFSHCLQGECALGSVSNALKPNDEHLRILRSVYSVLDRKLAANALASSVSSLASDLLNLASNSDLIGQFQSISCLLCAVVNALGDIFDGFHFVNAIINIHSGACKTITSAHTTARLVFECSLLVTRTVSSLQAALEVAAPRQGNKKSSFYNFDSVDEGELNCFRNSMLGLRKSILRWCASDLCSVYHNKVSQEEETKCSDTYYERGAVIKGPGAPDFNSILGTEANPSPKSSSPFHRMMTLIRCMLFLSPPSSKEMESFAMTGEEMQNDRFHRFDFCCQYGVDVDDEMLQIILSSADFTQNTALSIIETLVGRCGSTSAAKICCKVSTVWKMYSLAEYSPMFRSDFGNKSGSFSSDEKDSDASADEGSDTEHFGRKGRKPEGGHAPQVVKPDKWKLPRLAVTSLWWRVSSIALVLSGILPEQVGKAMWDEAPTLRALIRMTTSQKYRFPTADCNENEKERVRQAEEKAREEEAKIAELLFMPPRQKKTTKPTTKILSPSQQRRGLRSSARQRAKMDKLLAVEQERQAAALHAENVKLRKVLRLLQKNIMIWDPKQGQRKPPKGSIALLLSVNDRFGLAEKFRLSTSPDFLLLTIGEGSSRTQIERAYDWLIPIISSHAAIIDRLQPSASCFLLLRAYGVEGDKNRELLDLTAPLLSHVSGAIRGEFGEHHALLAMELLLQDIADEGSDRRRCARKVLQEAVGDADVTSSSQYDLGNCGWLFQMMHVKNSELVPLVIKYISKALAYERGKVLSIYVSALSEYKDFLEKHKIQEDFDFASTLCELIALRSHVCSDAFDRFTPLRALAIAEVEKAFEHAVTSNGAVNNGPASSLVTITVPRKVTVSAQNGDDVTNVVVSSNLLHASIILISNWQRRDSDEREAQNEETSISCLLRFLVIPFMPNGSGEAGENTGLASAKNKHNKKRAVSIDEWVLLAKARADKVAKQAALSAPNIFLPRLLLCCGLQKLSFYTMLSRLDQLVDSSTDSGLTFKELISPSAVSEWGLTGIGSRSTIKRKLYGRILAYMRIHGKHTTDEETQEWSMVEKSPFVSWLSSENRSCDNAKKGKAFIGISDNSKPLASDSLHANDFEDLMEEDDDEAPCDIWSKYHSENMAIDRPIAPNENVSHDFVNSCVANDQYNVLQESLDLIMAKSVQSKEMEGATAAAKVLLATYDSFRDNPIFVRMVLKWVPLLTQERGDDHLWQLIFVEESGQMEVWQSLVCGCALKWSDEHIAACQVWISQQTKCFRWKAVSSLDLVMRFLVVSSEQKSIHCFHYDDNDAHLQFPYPESQECATSLTKLILHYVDLEDSGAVTNGSSKGQTCIAAEQRNVLPDWLTLILLIGKSHQALVTRLVLEKIDEASSPSSLVLSSIILRLYVISPLKMNLSDSKLRNALLQASDDHLPMWLDWRCPLDCQMSEMLSNLSKSPHQRLVQSVTDIAKQHPLILSRHLNSIKQRLLEDGSGRDSEQQSLMKRGRIFGKHPSGDAVAQIVGRTVKVTVVLWGYSFNEPIWTSVLDVLMALPVEVAFTCGAKIGLTGVLELYLRLFAVQVVDLNSESNILRVRDKFAKLIESFRRCKPKAFEDWVKLEIPHWGNVQRLLSISSIGA